MCMFSSESKLTLQFGGTTVTESYSSINNGPLVFVFLSSDLPITGVSKNIFLPKKHYLSFLFFTALSFCSHKILL